MTPYKTHTTTRRTILQAVAAGTAVSVVTKAVAAQEALDGEIELGGRRSAWVGQAPDEIADERNPTLRLTEGQEYTLTWENLDGDGHNVVIEDEDGENFLSTDIVSGVGTTQTVEFTAEAGMAEYYCAPHPSSMRGEIELVDGEEAEEEEPVEEEPDENGVLVPEGPTVGLETVADGLAAPVDLQAAPGDDENRYVVDQVGQIYVHGPDGLEEEPFLDLEDRMVELDPDFDERGLLGLAFHPEFEENRRFFVHYSAPAPDGAEIDEGEDGDEEDEPEEEVDEEEPEEENDDETDEDEDELDHIGTIAEFEADDDGTSADPGSERIILEIPHPQFNHNAGPLAFGPDDGYLYVTTGDGGAGGDVGPGHVDDWYDEIEGGNGQDTSENLLGGILRIDVDENGEGDQPYAIPDDNPLVGYDDYLPEYYAWGMRNPWGMSFTRDGELLAADVGQALFEIINHVERGGNYGWNVREGTHCFDPETPEEPPEDCPQAVDEDVPEPRGGEPLLDPVVEYPQFYGDQEIGIAVIGGYLYETGTVPALEGNYVFGDWSLSFDDPSGSLFVAYPPEGWPDEDDLEETFADQVPEGADEEIFQEDRWEGLWPVEQLQVEGDVAENGRLERFVLGFGRDADDELYVLTTEEGGPTGETGQVHRIVDANGESDADEDEEVEDGEDGEDDGEETTEDES
ncbi:PQQ-dependent sugar dehydrogenase [Natrononativus amylolyticus]|uniref:PQQ-dependent sugar dehydrogenase n=1 Tax=Natrononativus amylolyticus TaxID=2963434 RepID=UPI0020CEF7B8|nr:PQQ-dependent sugar dehydrogenase [Natrononativus amylolyticus]